MRERMCEGLEKQEWRWERVRRRGSTLMTLLVERGGHLAWSLVEWCFFLTHSDRTWP